MKGRGPVVWKHLDLSRDGEFMIRSVDGEDSVHPHRRLSLQGHNPIDAIRTKCNFRIAVALQHLSMHFVVTHSAATVTALCIHYDFARNLARSGITRRTIKTQSDPCFKRKVP